MIPFPGVAGILGWGILAYEGVNLSITRGLITSNSDAGLRAVAEGTEVHLEDVLIRDTRSSRMGYGGRGLQIQEGASLSADGLYIVGNREAGVFVVDENTLFEAHELVVSNTREAACAANNTCPFLGGFGDGVVVLGGATVNILISSSRKIKG